MSYAEAKRDRKRSRRNENLSLILGLLGGLAKGFSAQKQRGEDQRLTEQRDELKWNREKEMQERKMWADQENEARRGATQLKVAEMYSNREQNRGTPEWLAEGMGIVGDRDPNEVLSEFEQQINAHRTSKDYDPLFGDEAIKDTLSQRDKVRSIIGYGRAQGMRQKPPPETNRTGELNPTSTSAGPNVGAEQGQRQYSQLYRSLMGAKAQNDPMAWEQIRQTFPQLGIPPYHLQRPGMFGQSMQNSGMPQ